MEVFCILIPIKSFQLHPNCKPSFGSYWLRNVQYETKSTNNSLFNNLGFKWIDLVGTLIEISYGREF